MTRDPLVVFKKKLLDKGIPEEFFEKIEDQVTRELDEAVEFSQNSPLPSPEEALDDIWVVK
jgi:TPP-dependent pyruvate/acetoin dehydrogenase alpha subunit